jgi:hypothetical protein
MIDDVLQIIKKLDLILQLFRCKFNFVNTTEIIPLADGRYM